MHMIDASKAYRYLQTTQVTAIYQLNQPVKLINGTGIYSAYFNNNNDNTTTAFIIILLCI